MFIYKTVFIEVQNLSETTDQLDDNEVSYSYRDIESGDEVEVETSEENINILNKLDIITKEEYNQLLSDAVDYIYLY
jgi:BMFP domain-containing protein YqiC